MSLIRFTNQYPSLFDSFINNDLLDWSRRNYSKTNTTIPSVNIKETGNTFEVEVAAPGFAKGDFKLEVHNDLLTISTEKKTETSKEENTYSHREFSYQSFTRSFTLPEVANPDNISATYNNGVLAVTIPKKEAALPKPARAIEVS